MFSRRVNIVHGKIDTAKKNGKFQAKKMQKKMKNKFGGS